MCLVTKGKKNGVSIHIKTAGEFKTSIHTALNDKTSKSSIDAETSVILILKSFEIQAFANPRHHQWLASMSWIGKSLEFFIQASFELLSVLSVIYKCYWQTINNYWIRFL